MKNRIETIVLEIDRLNGEERAEVLKHLEESLAVLKLGSLLQFNTPVVKTESVRVKEEYPVAAVGGLYNGLTPTCTECGATFRTLGLLDTHIKQFHPQKYQENVANAKILVSRKSKSAISPPITPKVEEKLTSLDNNQVPESRKSEEKLFNCSDCDKSFGKRSSLRKHQICHTDRYKCETCGRGFAQNRDIENHVKAQSGCSRKVDEVSRVRGN